jgi:hypothetical protein
MERKETDQDVDIDCCIILKIGDLDADVVNTSFESLFTETYIGEVNFFLLDKLVVHLMYLFALGVPAYRIRFYVPLFDYDREEYLHQSIQTINL